MHNPNIADYIKGDKSSNLCLNKAVDEKCNELIVVNLYSKRSSESDELEKAFKVFEEENFNEINNALKESKLLVLAWGDKPGEMVKNRKFLNLLDDYSKPIKCFGINKSGEPKHPGRHCGENTPLINFDIKKYISNKRK